MSPTVSINVPTYTPRLAVSLGQVMVQGLWREPRSVFPRWKARRPARALWRPAQPPRPWKGNE